MLEDISGARSGPLRFRWLVIVLVFTGTVFVGGLIIRQIGQAPAANNNLPPTVGSSVMAEVTPLRVRLQVPQGWKAPTVRNASSFVLSPSGSPDTSTGAGPFLYVVVDAIKVFSGNLNIRSDLSDPVGQLGALLDALNWNGPRFSSPEEYKGARYPAAHVTGFDRGNLIEIVLLRTDEGRWIYVGSQAPEKQFAYYRETVFRLATDSLTLIP